LLRCNRGYRANSSRWACACQGRGSPPGQSKSCDTPARTRRVGPSDFPPRAIDRRGVSQRRGRRRPELATNSPSSSQVDASTPDGECPGLGGSVRRGLGIERPCVLGLLRCGVGRSDVGEADDCVVEKSLVDTIRPAMTLGRLKPGVPVCGGAIVHRPALLEQPGPPTRRIQPGPVSGARPVRRW
jgi:hypothetical protein